METMDESKGGRIWYLEVAENHFGILNLQGHRQRLQESLAFKVRCLGAAGGQLRSAKFAWQTAPILPRMLLQQAK